MTDTDQYGYVGPPAIREAVEPGARGWAIRAVGDLAQWLDRVPAEERVQPHTFVVDISGVLRVAPRRSEHVACAGGEPVLAAGEITFRQVARGWLVSEVTNQSTGYCPPVSSWPAVAAACAKVGLPHPGRFTAGFEFRRCPACGQINIVKDDDLICAACGGELPAAWNIA